MPANARDNIGPFARKSIEALQADATSHGLHRTLGPLHLVLLGIVMSVTGLILDFPNWNQGRQVMQQANVIHVIGGVLFIAGALGHIWMGLAMEGAYTGMRNGYVDETWAREHHSLWYEEVRSGKRPERIVTATPQPVPGDD